MDGNSISTKVLDELEAKIKAYESDQKARLILKVNLCEMVLSVLEPLVDEICKNATGKWVRVCGILKWIIPIVRKIC